jgi:hypothetical protein
VFDDVAGGEEDVLENGAPDGCLAQEEFEIHPEVLHLFLLGVLHDRPGGAILSTEMRCSYQPIASASSMTDVIIRAKVRVFRKVLPAARGIGRSPLHFLGESRDTRYPDDAALLTIA